MPIEQVVPIVPIRGATRAPLIKQLLSVLVPATPRNVPRSPPMRNPAILAPTIFSTGRPQAFPIIRFRLLMLKLGRLHAVKAQTVELLARFENRDLNNRLPVGTAEIAVGVAEILHVELLQACEKLVHGGLGEGDLQSVHADFGQGGEVVASSLSPVRAFGLFLSFLEYAPNLLPNFAMEACP